MGAHHLAPSVGTGFVVASDLDRLVNLVAPDCAIVATPDPTHVDLATACLRLGLHTLVEKPLATSPTDAALLAQRFEHSGLILGSGLVERFNPAWTALCERLADGSRVSSIRIVRDGPPPRDTSSGPVFDLAVHDLDLLLRWPGDRPLRILEAETSPSHLSARLSLGAISVELSASWRPGPAVRAWSVASDAHAWEADLQMRTLRRKERDGTTADIPVPAMDALELEHAAFAASIRGSVSNAFPGLGTHVRALELCQKLSKVG